MNLCHCTFSVPPTFKSFKNLIRLELKNVRFVGDTFGSFISSCPVLEKLYLNQFNGVDHLTIAASSLKLIEVYGDFTPICLKGCQGILSVTIGLLKKGAYDHTTKARDLIKFLSGSCKVQELYFRGWFFEFFARSCSLDIHERTFKHLKKLHISKICSASIFAFPFAIHLIQSCPEIEHLLLYFVITSSYVCKHEMGGDPCYRLRRL